MKCIATRVVIANMKRNGEKELVPKKSMERRREVGTITILVVTITGLKGKFTREGGRRHNFEREEL